MRALSKSNPNHDEHGRFTGDGDDHDESEISDAEIKAHAAHDDKLAEAHATIEGLHDQVSDHLDALTMIQQKLGQATQKGDKALDGMNAIRSKHGLDEFDKEGSVLEHGDELHDAVGDAVTALQAHVGEKYGSAKKIAKSASGLASATIRSKPVPAPLRMFIPITKVDAAQRLVYGIATGETLDRSGEVCDYASTKPFYEKWSGDIAKTTGGKNLGNVRAMHGKVAAGAIKTITFNDAAKQIEIAAKIVDDAEWRKVEEGVYTGFSQGGGYVKRWTDDAGHQRYTADPSEVSLVDLPCLPDATFQMVKAAGSVETKHFAKAVQVELAPPSNAEVNAKATELAKAAGRETEVATFFAPAREALLKAALPSLPESPKAGEVPLSTAETYPSPAPASGDGLEQVWKARDGSTFPKKADAVAHNAVLDDPSAKAMADKIAEISGALGIEKAADKPWSVASKTPEGNGKTTSHASKDAAMAEAAARDKAGHKSIMVAGEDGKSQAWAADKKADAGDLEKRGARNSAADMSMIQAMHDHACSLGASCDSENCGQSDDDAMAMAAINADLAKVTSAFDAMTNERDTAKAMAYALQKSMDAHTKVLDTLLAKVANIEQQPLPLPLQGSATRVVTKGSDDTDTGDLTAQLAKLKVEKPDEYQLLMIKVAQQNPQQLSYAR